MRCARGDCGEPSEPKRVKAQPAEAAIGYVAGATVHSDWVVSLLDTLTDERGGIRFRNRTFSTSATGGTPIYAARNVVTREFLLGSRRTDRTFGELEWLLMVDTDMVFTYADAERLVSHGKPLVSGLYVDADLRPLAFDWHEDKKAISVAKLQEDALIPVDVTGAGFLLMHRSVVEALHKLKGLDMWTPWGVGISEDVAFCLNARHLGIQLYVDTGVEIGHVKSVPLYPSR